MHLSIYSYIPYLFMLPHSYIITSCYQSTINNQSIDARCLLSFVSRSNNMLSFIYLMLLRTGSKKQEG